VFPGNSLLLILVKADLINWNKQETKSQQCLSGVSAFGSRGAQQPESVVCAWIPLQAAAEEKVMN